MMQKLLKESGLETAKIKIVGDITGVNFEDDITYFNVAERRYSKKRTAVEIAFMKFLLTKPNLPLTSNEHTFNNNKPFI